MSCGSRCSSRPPPLTCSRSSAARPSTYRLSSIPYSNLQPDYARLIMLGYFDATANISAGSTATAMRARCTRELAHSVEELRALGEVTQAVNSTLDLGTVLSTIVAKAAQLSGTEGGAIYVFDEVEQLFRLRATYGFSQELIAAVQDQHLGA